MNIRRMLLCISGVLLHVDLAGAQGTFLYDQQSADEAHFLEGSSPIQQNQFIGQSFIPTFSTVGFIRLFIYNGITGTSPANVYVNLREDSISGNVLSSTAPVLIPGGALFAGTVNFYFDTPVPVNPGTTYYFQPVVADNNNLGTLRDSYNYAGGTAFANGAPDPFRDLWFREGIVVPEPSSAILVLTAAGLATASRSIRKTREPAKDAKHTKS